MTNASNIVKQKKSQDETGAKAVTIIEVVNYVEVLVISISDTGVDTLDIGNLQNYWRQQPGSPIYGTDLNLSQLKKNLPTAKRELLPKRHEFALQFILKQNSELWMQWWKDCVTTNRNIY